MDCHVVHPSPTSESYANHNNLVPFRQWINLSHESTYIHGPFDFASINGRKTRDRISNDNWEYLYNLSERFVNALPKRDLPTFSVHVDNAAHTTVASCEISKCLLACAADEQPDSEQLYCWQKVFNHSTQNIFFLFYKMLEENSCPDDWTIVLWQFDTANGGIELFQAERYYCNE